MSTNSSLLSILLYPSRLLNLTTVASSRLSAETVVSACLPKSKPFGSLDWPCNLLRSMEPFLWQREKSTALKKPCALEFSPLLLLGLRLPREQAKGSRMMRHTAQLLCHHSQPPVMRWASFLSVSAQPILQLTRATWANSGETATPCPDPQNQPARSQAHKLNKRLLCQVTKFSVLYYPAMDHWPRVFTQLIKMLLH